MAPPKRKSAAPSKKKPKWPPQPQHASEAAKLMEYMKSVYNGPLKTSLQALSGDGTLEVSETLILMARYIRGETEAKQVVSERLEAAAAVKPQDSTGSVNAKPSKASLHEHRKEFDKWVLPPLERSIANLMKERWKWDKTNASPAEKLAQELMREARICQASQPHGAIIPSISVEEKSGSAYEFAHLISDVPDQCSDLINTGSLLMLVEHKLDTSNLAADLDTVASMVDQEGLACDQACVDAGKQLIKAIKKKRRSKGLIDGNDQEAVAGALEAVRALVTNAAGDITSALKGMKGQVEVLASSKNLEAALDSTPEQLPVEESPAEAEAEIAPPPDTEVSESTVAATQPAEATDPAAAPEAAGKDAADGELLPAVENEQPESQPPGPTEPEEGTAPPEVEEKAAAVAPSNSQTEAETAPPAVASGPADWTAEVDAALQRLDQMIEAVQTVAEDAVKHMEGSVEAILYDSGADLIAQIFLEERAAVQALALYPWQVKVARTKTVLLTGMERIVDKLISPEDRAKKWGNGPVPVSINGLTAQSKLPPYFEVLTILISAMCRCLGDAERSLGIGLEPGSASDMELLATVKGVTMEGSPETGTYKSEIKQIRVAAEASLKSAISKVVQLAEWRTEVDFAAMPMELFPARLLALQLKMCRALQRLQSRLMSCLKSSQAPATILWDPNSLEVIEQNNDGSAVAANENSVHEAAAMVPFLRAAKGLHELLIAEGADGQKKVTRWLAFAQISVSELERCCNHINQEVEGFADMLLSSAKAQYPRADAPQPQPVEAEEQEGEVAAIQSTAAVAGDGGEAEEALLESANAALEADLAAADQDELKSSELTGENDQPRGLDGEGSVALDQEVSGVNSATDPTAGASLLEGDDDGTAEEDLEAAAQKALEADMVAAEAEAPLPLHAAAEADAAPGDGGSAVPIDGSEATDESHQPLQDGPLQEDGESSPVNTDANPAEDHTPEDVEDPSTFEPKDDPLSHLLRVHEEVAKVLDMVKEFMQGLKRSLPAQQERSNE